ncbi:MAG: hypothetical protein ACLTSG_13990 [Lachnospiraceae bacterium]
MPAQKAQARERAGRSFEARAFMRLRKAVHSMGEPESFTPEDLEKQRRSQDALGNMAASMSGLVWEPFTLAGMDAAWMRLSREHRRRRVILYCHGGGYTSGGLGFPRSWPRSSPGPRGWTPSPSTTASRRSTPTPRRWRMP